PSDFFEDGSRRCGPDERFWFGIVMVEVLLDGSFKFGHTLEDTASDAIGSYAAEEALDLVEPRRRCRGEVHVETRMPLKPSLHLGVLVGGVIVSDEGRSSPCGLLRSMVRRNLSHSWWRWRFMHCPITWPVAILRAA